ncbi:hypothetical protein M413DRAFT_446328 [Hebeloma cylindrosporum]|uniref:Uncharacterized protein n=1 Tax=Hebeloma cylindrosporum TaxID=76867 RepID=A0A0C2YGE5_HEBCY|nr:hypothetical protein M413DRAFT_446328 [Hebeloma cylindrosporum h7]
MQLRAPLVDLLPSLAQAFFDCHGKPADLRSLPPKDWLKIWINLDLWLLEGTLSI